MGQSNHNVPTESRVSMTYRGTSSDNTDHPTQVHYSQVDMLHLRKICFQIRGEVDNVMTRIEARFQDAVLTAIEKSFIPRMELVLNSANASTGRSIDNNVLETDQRDLSGIIQGLQMTAPRRIKSRTDLNRIDETRGSITVNEGDFLVNENCFDRQTHTHHKCLVSMFL